MEYGIPATNRECTEFEWVTQVIKERGKEVDDTALGTETRRYSNVAENRFIGLNWIFIV